MCNCSDNGEHQNPAYHSPYCQYAIMCAGQIDKEDKYQDEHKEICKYVQCQADKVIKKNVPAKQRAEIIRNDIKRINHGRQ